MLMVLLFLLTLLVNIITVFEHVRFIKFAIVILGTVAATLKVNLLRLFKSLSLVFVVVVPSNTATMGFRNGMGFCPQSPTSGTICQRQSSVAELNQATKAGFKHLCSHVGISTQRGI